ncbi:hypothetical protein GMORB2_7365 [Geosmithia morbida]|uniref:Vacuolar import and degradation protein n=1 Tax=Geosmithia morbida TaxID=1094350 RepID=A0A9P5D055_9HYPO|nr:uncharacterized protein GMORB2_7365 [Geosmithia morbida]KAF4122373.1 hypothetical protein GMORB2_7365 [Geosmithia morbida]
MPTPSNQPSGPPSPPGFSSCPDDLQTSPRPGRQTELEREANSAHDTEMGERDFVPSALAVENPPQRGSSSAPPHEDSLIVEERATLDPSSRSTTMSPQPRSSITTATSPEQGRHMWSHSNTSDIYVDSDDFYAPSMGPDYPSMRAKPLLNSSYLRPGSRFHGTQQSERQVYDVSVEIKHVDLRESFLCGYLRIQGLTEDHPTLTTYFEGEIIGPKYNFFTQHEDWGATQKVDMSHWSKFVAFRPFQKQARRGHATVEDVTQREHVFMRWKEHFLVPDHRVRTISGASFEGFYYICFNQIKGAVSGIYFHSKSEKFQQLELTHVPDRGCFSATEFR